MMVRINMGGPRLYTAPLFLSPLVSVTGSSTGSYVAVEKFFFFIGTASIGVGILLWMRDSRSGGMLNSPVRSRGTEPLDPSECLDSQLHVLTSWLSSELPIEGSSIETGPGSEEESTQEMSEDDRLLFNEHIVDG